MADEEKVQQIIRYLALQRDNFDIRNRNIIDDLHRIILSHKEMRHFRHDCDAIQRKQHNLLHLKEIQNEMSSTSNEFQKDRLKYLENVLIKKLHRLKYFTPDELQKIIDSIEFLAKNAIDDEVKEKMNKLHQSYLNEVEWINSLIELEKLSEEESDYDGDIEEF